MLSARELNPAALPNRTWVNERLTFTHGHGLTLGPVNQVTAEGLPVLFIRDLPPVSTVNLPVTEPSLYFGELSNEYAIVKHQGARVPLPQGRRQRLLDLRRAPAASCSTRSGRSWPSPPASANYQLLLSDDITPESRLIFDRQIKLRAQKIAPFLTFDDDPYLVVHDGRLFWMLDAYTVTSRYPYATEGAPGVSYIRNAVKVVVDAYHGTTTFYLAEPGDPIIRAVREGLPWVAAAARGHARGPAPARALSRRHLRRAGVGVLDLPHDSAAVFYNKEDQWEVPTIDASGQAVRMTPYYTIMRLPGESRAEFIQMLPFTPRRRDNLASWLVARIRRRAVRPAHGLRVPEAEARLRAAAGGGAHQPGPGDLAADHAVEPAGLRGDPGHADGDPDRGVAALRAPAVPARAAGTHPRADARDRRLPELHRDGAHARCRARRGSSPPRPIRARPRAAAGRGPGERRRRRRPRPGTPAPPAGPQAAAPGSGRAGAACAPLPGATARCRRRNSPPRRRPRISAPSRRNARATGRSTAPKSPGSASCSSCWRSCGRERGPRDLPRYTARAAPVDLSASAKRGSTSARRGSRSATWSPPPVRA